MASSDKKHWSSQREVTSPLGIRILLAMYRFGGKPAFLLLACPVVFYYFLSARSARRASLGYLRRLSSATESGKAVGLSANWWWSYRHFVSFSLNLLDQFSVWWGEFNDETVKFPDRDVFSDLSRKKIGAVILTSHLGNTEMCRALSAFHPEIKLNILVHTNNAEEFNKLLSRVNGHRQMELIEVSNISAATAIILSERISNGELVIIAADRTPVGSISRKIEADFLGERALFPQGPFILAALLKCPVYTLFCLRDNDCYRVHLDLFDEQLQLPRKTRYQTMQQYAQRFSDRLAYYCRQAPLQWYNFYDFWQGTDSSDTGKY